MLHFEMNMPFSLMMVYGSIMIVVVLLFRAFLKNRMPKFVFPVLWCVVLVRLLLPFSLSSPITISNENIRAFMEMSPDTASASTTDTTAIVYENVTVMQGTGDALPDEALPFRKTVQNFHNPALIPFLSEHLWFLLYLTGAVLTAVILLIQKRHYRIRLKSSLPVEHNETINALLCHMRMEHIPVCTNDEIASPLVCGLFAPRIYLPTRMDFQDKGLLRHILLHETMHIRHRDNLIKTIMLIALCVHWFNPLVWLMAKCLASDLEAACDEAVLKQCKEKDERQSYAFHLLAMTVTGSRTPLFYSAFSKTEVEKRIRNILHYRKTSALLLSAALVFLSSSVVVFAAGAPTPFDPYLTRTLASDQSRWCAKVYTTRALTLGNDVDAQKRAEDIVFDVMRANTDDNPAHMESEIKTLLTDEFHVEKNAFRIHFTLCLSDEELREEYAAWDITEDEMGYFHYQGKPVRVFLDKMGGRYHSHSMEDTSLADITVIRDECGYLSEIMVLRAGDTEYDRRTETAGSESPHSSTYFLMR